MPIPPKYLVVTGADAGYFRCLQQLLLSLQRWKVPGCVVYDLGLSGVQRADLSRRFPWLEWRSLPPGPEHLRDLGNYAWKPTVVAEVAREWGRPFLWLDSACLVVGNLQPVFDHVVRCGLWVPYAGRGALVDMTLPETMARLDIEPAIQQGRFRAGGVCAFDPGHPGALALIEQWRELAWRLEILAPPGSHHQNHRYDQTLLTVLIARSDLDPSTDELDMSCTHPIPYLQTRKKVYNFVPLALDGVLRAYFQLWVRLEIAYFIVHDFFRRPASRPRPC